MFLKSLRFLLIIFLVMLIPVSLFAAPKEQKDPLKECSGNLGVLQEACEKYAATAQHVYISDKSISNLPFNETKGLLNILGEHPHHLHKKAQQQLAKKFICPEGGHYFVSITKDNCSVKCDKHGNKKEIEKEIKLRSKRNQYILIAVVVVVLFFFFVIFR